MKDPEIDAMSAVAGALADLADDARGRVLRWAVERYSSTSAVRLSSSEIPAEKDGPGAVVIEENGQVSDGEIAAEAPEFEHFAELFAAAHPRRTRTRPWSPPIGCKWSRIRSNGSPEHSIAS